MKDDKKSVEMAKESDVHVEPIGADMLTQINVSIKELNLLKKKSELISVSSMLTMSIDKPNTNEEDEVGLTPEKEKSTCLRKGLVAK
jgi:hypothetical protein